MSRGLRGLPHASAKNAEGWSTRSLGVRVRVGHPPNLDLLPSLVRLGTYYLRLRALPCPAIDCYVPSGLSRSRGLSPTDFDSDASTGLCSRLRQRGAVLHPTNEDRSAALRAGSVRGDSGLRPELFIAGLKPRSSTGPRGARLEVSGGSRGLLPTLPQKRGRMGHPQLGGCERVGYPSHPFAPRSMGTRSLGLTCGPPASEGWGLATLIFCRPLLDSGHIPFVSGHCSARLSIVTLLRDCRDRAVYLLPTLIRTLRLACARASDSSPPRPSNRPSYGTAKAVP